MPSPNQELEFAAGEGGIALRRRVTRLKGGKLLVVGPDRAETGFEECDVGFAESEVVGDGGGVGVAHREVDWSGDGGERCVHGRVGGGWKGVGDGGGGGSG